VTAVVTVAAFAATRAKPGSAPAAGGARPSILLGLGAALAGVLAAVALACYLFATTTQSLGVAVVLSSLYPVVPVFLGVMLMQERLSRSQVLGLAGALTASVLISVS
jgi:drug/metabolite transporter (DMT)-like permease